MRGCHGARRGDRAGHLGRLRRRAGLPGLCRFVAQRAIRPSYRCELTPGVRLAEGAPTRWAMNTATLGGRCLEEALDACARAGFTEVELRGPELIGRLDIEELLVAHGINAISISAVELSGTRAEAVDQAKRYAELAASASIPYVLCVPGRARDGLEHALAEIAVICQDQGVTPAFEFMGFPWCSVRTLRESLDIARDVGGLPVVLDYFHWFAGPNEYADLARLRPGELAVTHINDAPAGDISRLRDADRVLPGYGGQPVVELTRRIADTGYAGPYSVELFNPHLWELGARTAANLSRASLFTLTDGLNES